MNEIDWIPGVDVKFLSTSKRLNIVSKGRFIFHIYVFSKQVLRLEVRSKPKCKLNVYLEKRDNVKKDIR